MLKELKVSNFAIIDNLELEFNQGLVVLTGETGAGKSIIADAISFLFGSRASSDLIKHGTKKAIVEGVLTISPNLKKLLEPWMQENGFESETNHLFLSREISEQGSKARINGSLSNVSHLLHLRAFLFENHEQSEHIDLLKSDKQLAMLDVMGESKHRVLLEEHKNLYNEYVKIKLAYNKNIENVDEVKRKIDFLKHQIKEISLANIKNELEEEDLTTRRNILLNKKDLIDKTSQIAEILNGDFDNNCISQVVSIKKLLNELVDYDASFSDYLNKVESAFEELKDLSSFSSSYASEMAEEDSDLEEIEVRLDLFYKLKKKYGPDLASVINSEEKARLELSELENLTLSKDELEVKLKSIEKNLQVISEQLSKSRAEIAETLSCRVNQELESLGFQKVLFKISVSDSSLTEFGKDNVDFTFSANIGEPLKPISKVASGGELSRIMLAIKACEVRRKNDSFSKLIIFDEIDSGVSGEVSSSVARKLYSISRQNQVICITHQPIVAAIADQNIYVRKKILDDKTVVEILDVKENEKEDILASLINPEKQSKDISEEAKKYAKSLLESANKSKFLIKFP